MRRGCHPTMTNESPTGNRKPTNQNRIRIIDGQGTNTHPAAHLRSVVVEYADKPDKCTICPKNLSSHELLASWITANNEAFVDLLEVR